MGKEIRQPKQERAIEKKNRIIQAGFDLFSEVGYYNTNTAQIAKRAGVSTGIVYGYFKDKRDILLDVLSVYVERVFAPLLHTIDNMILPRRFRQQRQSFSAVFHRGILYPLNTVHKQNILGFSCFPLCQLSNYYNNENCQKFLRTLMNNQMDAYRNVPLQLEYSLFADSVQLFYVRFP